MLYCPKFLTSSSDTHSNHSPLSPDPLDISDLPCLRLLTLVVMQVKSESFNYVSWVIDVLSKVQPDNKLEEVRIACTIESTQPCVDIDADGWSVLDALLSRRLFTGLHKVWLNVHLLTEQEEYHSIVAALTKNCPYLTNKRLLSITRGYGAIK